MLSNSTYCFVSYVIFCIIRYEDIILFHSFHRFRPSEKNGTANHATRVGLTYNHNDGSHQFIHVHIQVFELCVECCFCSSIQAGIWIGMASRPFQSTSKPKYLQTPILLQNDIRKILQPANSRIQQFPLFRANNHHIRFRPSLPMRLRHVSLDTQKSPA